MVYLKNVWYLVVVTVKRKKKHLHQQLSET